MDPAKSGTEIGALWVQWVGADWAGLVATSLGVIGVVLAAVFVHLVLKYVVLRAVEAVVRRSNTTWDDVMHEQRVFERLSGVGPALVVHEALPFVVGLPEAVSAFVQRVALALMVVIVARSISALLTGVNAIYVRYEVARGRPIKGYVQVAQLVTYLLATIFMLAALMDESPWYFVTGLGAMTAVLLLIFRDTLLSLVAGIQLTNNDLIRVGDWIEMPGFQADGDVVDIALNVVKVQNWDRTITVIPTHKFLEHSFRNWRGMFEAGGRRIKRSLFVDMSTIRFLTEDEIARFRRFKVLGSYIDDKMSELTAFNAANVPVDGEDLMVNKRWLTNVGTLRAYISAYLRAHPQIHQDMTFLVRQLQPTEQGLPIEIYVFTNDTRWAVYEGIQADLFDHILAVVPEFGLRVFQEPAGSDIRALKG